MADHPWGQDVLDYCIGPNGSDDFYKTHFEKKALIVSRNEPDRYRDLLSVAKIDTLLASRDFHADDLDMARANPQISREQFVLANGFADRGSVANLYQEGATLILPHLHQADLGLKSFCRAMESIFSSHVQTNIYLTPPNNQGFRTHYDDHDVFVLQVEGEKLWRLYDQSVDKPYRGEGFNPEHVQPGELVEEFVLKAGDCAYVPRGLMHDAQAQGEADSLHITVGMIVKTWADLMLEAVSEVALRHPEFRQSLPPGYARADFDRSIAQAHFDTLVKKIGEEADMDGAFDLFVDNFIRSRPPYSEGAITGRGGSTMPGAKFRLRPHIPWRLAEDEDRLVLITAGGELVFPSAVEAGLDKVLDGDVIDLSTFEAAGEDEAQNALNQLFGYGVVERVS
jgi:ribosomal protein L16 Arg81 hydroxylase